MSNNSVTVGGVDLGGSSYGLMVVRAPVAGSPVVSVDSHLRGGLRGGGVSGFARHGGRVYTFECVVSGSSRADLAAKLDAVKRATDPEDGETLWVFDRETGLSDAVNRGYYGRRQGQIVETPMGTTMAGFSMSLLVPEGVARGVSAETQSDNVNSDPETLYVPAAADEVVGGTARCLPVIEITNTDTEDVLELTVTNETTEETLTWSGVLSEDWVLRIDCEREQVELSMDAGVTWGNAMSGLGAGDPFPSLQDGVRNEWTVTGLVGGTVDWGWRVRFI